jgi:polysaccharide export outer membrane protein
MTRCLGLLLLLAACAAPAASPPPPPAAVPAEYRLQPGDEIEVLFDDVPDLNLRQAIRSDGRISMPLVPDLDAAGRGVAELRRALVDAYRGQLVHPDITVVLRHAGGNRVFVGGEVNLQGAEPLDAPLTAARAIILAQGLKPTADASQVLLIRTDAAGRSVGRTLDLSRVLDGDPQGADVALQPFDVVFVPTSPIARIDRFVDQYIRQILPAQPSFLYQINSGSSHP